MLRYIAQRWRPLLRCALCGALFALFMSLWLRW